MAALAWVIGVLFSIILFMCVIGGLLCLVEWIVEIKHKCKVDNEKMKAKVPDEGNV
jgi:hypothetical protein